MAGIPRALTIEVLYGRFKKAREKDPKASSISCDRCKTPVTPYPANNGAPRQNGHPRTRYIIPLGSSFGRKAVDNVAVFCGECNLSFTAAGTFIIPEQYADWLDTLVEDQVALRKRSNRLLEMERELKRDASAAGALSEFGRSKEKPMSEDVSAEALADFDVDHVVDTADEKDTKSIDDI